MIWILEFVVWLAALLTFNWLVASSIPDKLTGFVLGLGVAVLLATTAREAYADIRYWWKWRKR